MSNEEREPLNVFESSDRLSLDYGPEYVTLIQSTQMQGEIEIFIPHDRLKLLINSLIDLQGEIEVNK